MVHTLSLLLENKKENKLFTYQYGEILKDYTKLKPDTESYILHDYIYMTVWRRQYYRDRN